MNLSDLRTLGHSGLPVSPMALGTMTFGNPAWGAPEETSTAIFNAYVDAGGNFIDTADVYSGGRSEELVGRFVQERKLRDKLVLATKFSFAGGNGRKNLHRALDASLRRLATDYIDLYWMHVWDGITPPEEMLQSLGDLVHAGKIRYFGYSDMPAWYVSRAVTLAQAHNTPGPIAMQLPYSLLERTIEHEFIPAARELGLGITPWSPLAFGLLTGKYTRNEEGKPTGESGRLAGNNPNFQRFNDRQWRTLDTVRTICETAGEPMAKVALAWAAAQPRITSLILGANTVQQLQQNLDSLTLFLSPAQMAELNQASELETSFYSIFSAQTQRGIFGGQNVQGFR